MHPTFLDGLEVVDSHHHFWDLHRFPYSWLAPNAPPARFGSKASIAKNYLPPDYLADMAPINLVGSVHVQANCGAADPVAETRWLQELSDSTGWPSAIIAEVDLCDPNAETIIKAHAAYPALRGIRTPVAWDEAGRWRVAKYPQVLHSPQFRAQMPLLAELGLCLEMVVVPAQLGELADLAQSHPDVCIVVNHFATLEPDQPENADDWYRGITGLAERPNVQMKLSGLWTADKGWSADLLRPFVDHLISHFGADRILYGSNLPVEGVNCPLPQQIAQLAKILADQPKDVVQKIFAQSARRVYRL